MNVCFSPIKPQPEHTAPELALVVTYQRGAAVRNPATAAPYNSGALVVPAPAPVVPDPPGAQRQARADEPVAGSRGGNLLRWLRKQHAPVRRAAIAARWGSSGSTLNALCDKVLVTTRHLKLLTIARPVTEYLAAGRPWPALPAGAVEVSDAD